MGKGELSGVRRQIDVMGPYRDQPAIPKWIWLSGLGTLIVAVAAMLAFLAG